MAVVVAPPGLERAAAYDTTLSWHAQVPGNATNEGKSKAPSRRQGGKQLAHMLESHEAISESANMDALILRELGSRSQPTVHLSLVL